MAGIEVDPQWLMDYATHVCTRADELERNSHDLANDELNAGAFGELGKQIGASEAYQRLQTQLLSQLDRTVAALRSAGEELTLIAGHHDAGEQQNVALMRQAMRD